MSETVRTLKPMERERTYALETLAFASDPIMRWFFPDPAAYLGVFRELADAFGGRSFEHGTGYVDTEFRGAAMWLPEGVQSDSEALGAAVAGAVEPAFLEAAAPFFEQMEAQHPKEPHWYLPMIGVDPAYQGQGVGGALLGAALRDCDRHGLPAYLESSNAANIPLYQRHGFEVVAEIQVSDSPLLYPMYRPARKQRA